MQSTGNLHHLIRDTGYGEAQQVFDNAAPFDASNGVFNLHPRAGEDAVEKLLGYAQRLAFGLFLGCMVSTPAGS